MRSVVTAGALRQRFAIGADQVNDQNVVIVPLLDEGDLLNNHYDLHATSEISYKYLFSDEYQVADWIFRELLQIGGRWSS